MNKRAVVLTFIFFCGISYADIYKWVDSQGNVHFSDTPHRGAEKLNIPDAQTYSAPVPQAPASDKAGQKQDGNAHVYTKLVIAQPENEATIRNNQGSITVTAEVDPDLFPGDKVQLIFDGSTLGEPQSNLLFQLSGVYRGSHTIAVQIVDAEGNVLETSDPVTVYVFRSFVGMGKGGNSH